MTEQKRRVTFCLRDPLSLVTLTLGVFLFTRRRPVGAVVLQGVSQAMSYLQNCTQGLAAWRVCPRRE